MGEPAAQQISEAMNRLWQKFLPQIQERVATLQAAADLIASGRSPTADEQSKAASDAHKLAGVLGTFGLSEGTELAREAEEIFERALEPDSAAVARMTEIAERLKMLTASRG